MMAGKKYVDGATRSRDDTRHSYDGLVGKHCLHTARRVRFYAEHGRIRASSSIWKEANI